MKTLKLAITATIASALATAANAQLIDPSFESNPISTWAGVLTPFQAGSWGVENGSISTATSTLNPLGTRMLRLNVEPGFATQAVQLVNLSSISTSINAGNVTAMGLAFFAHDLGGISATPIGGVTLQAYGANPTWGVPLASWSNNINVTTPGQWQMAQVSTVVLPTGTTWLAFEVHYLNSSIPNQYAFVDEANLKIQTIPEPITLLGVIPAIALVARRFRKN
jgi:hypothetical protein